MPELPEVETIVRALRNGGRDHPTVVGRKVERAELIWPRTLAIPDAAEFARRLAGQVFQAVERRAKYIVCKLDLDYLLVHLRMSGDLRVEAESEPVQTHDRLLVHFADGMRLAFNDTRKFGRVWLVSDPQSVLDALGPEPFDPAFSAEILYQKLQRSHRQIKPLLLDQGFIAGVGNIYSDEALHLAGINPLTPADQIPLEKAEKLWGAIREVFEEGIRRNGASIDWVYRGGDFQNYFRVYQRTGEPCLVCGSMIVRRTIGQRSAHFCPTCQPE
jgi:formamidopyrimidine-DNA glycosylase